MVTTRIPSSRSSLVIADMSILFAVVEWRRRRPSRHNQALAWYCISMALSIDLSGRVVLVTGGQRGIGRGITEAFAEAGATVVTCARSEAENPVAGTTHVQCDVRDPESVQALVDGIVAEHGRLGVLVNNAGGAPAADAATASPRFHDKIIGLNLNAPLLVAQIANAVMQAQPA